MSIYNVYIECQCLSLTKYQKYTIYTMYSSSSTFYSSLYNMYIVQVGSIIYMIKLIIDDILGT